MHYFPKSTFSPRYGDEFFTCYIDDYHVEDNCCFGQHVVYTIRVLNGKKFWTVHRRFSSFHELGRIFLQRKAISTNLPPKTLFYPSTIDEAFIRKRKATLDLFLDDFLRQVSLYVQKDIMCCSEVVAFLELGKGAHPPTDEDDRVTSN